MRFVVDGDEVSQEDIVKFKGLSPEEWQQIQQVIFTMTINHPVICPICLNGTEEITAPQITACGHVFCAPCILRHCKVCNTLKTQPRSSTTVLSATSS